MPGPKGSAWWGRDARGLPGSPTNGPARRLDELDDDLSAEDYEAFTEQIVDQASAAETIPELEADITLKHLEEAALAVVHQAMTVSGRSYQAFCKTSLRCIRKAAVAEADHLTDTNTLNYLVGRISGMWAAPKR